ncbi:hypothetical protein [Streptomyces massasporeus]|uniref:hypothetical protein n=1 Tax=Streptomyces massasporeus TaxID=67324 RepID=UPI00167513C8|nr:hypothetical protein [Streptomyces massasporeus]GGV91764.1 hypothetical protein GCM10010228_82880 [Streptomyces massasporeus]
METGNDATTARLAPEVEQVPGLLPAIAELAVFPVTALSDDTDPARTPSFWTRSASST